MGNGRKGRRCVSLIASGKRKGERCPYDARPGSTTCGQHSKRAKKGRTKGGKATGAKTAKAKREAEAVRSQVAAPDKLNIGDWEDLRQLCEERLATVPPQFSSWWLSALTKCLEHLADQNTVHYVVYADPLDPKEPVPPLPDLPGFEFSEIDDDGAP